MNSIVVCPLLLFRWSIVVVALLLGMLTLKSCHGTELQPYISLGFGQSKWSDPKNTRFYSFSDLATCEQSRGCKGYSQEVVTNDTTRSWQAFVGIRPLWWFSSEVGHFNLGSSDVAFNLDGSYTDCLFRSSTCTGKFSERLSFNTSGNWIRTGFHVSLWEMDFSLSPGIAFTKIQTFNSYSAYNLTFPDGSVHTGEAHRNETKRKRIFTHTFGVSGEVVKGWHMGAEYTPYWRVRYMADQGGGNPPEKVDIKIQSLMFTFAKIF